MTNEQYLIVSYFTVGALCVALAVAVYMFLRSSFVDILQHMPQKNMARILKRLFLIGIVFPALFGFLSVSFYSCSKDTYSEIIDDRGYLIEKNREEMTTTTKYIITALFVWSFIIGGTIYLSRKKEKSEAARIS
jgi:hypothetical protein